MEESTEKKRFSVSPIIAILISIIIIYFLVYSVLRINHDLIHLNKNTLNEKHTIQAIMPEGHELYKEALVSVTSPEKTDSELQRKIKYHQNKKKYLESIFYPFIKVEEFIWNQLDH